MTSALSTTPLFSRLSTTSSSDVSCCADGADEVSAPALGPAARSRCRHRRSVAVSASRSVSEPADEVIRRPRAGEDEVSVERDGIQPQRDARPRGTARATSRSRERRHRVAAATIAAVRRLASNCRARQPRERGKRVVSSHHRFAMSSPAPRHARVSWQPERRCRSSRRSALGFCGPAFTPAIRTPHSWQPRTRLTTRAMSRRRLVRSASARASARVHREELHRYDRGAAQAGEVADH